MQVIGTAGQVRVSVVTLQLGYAPSYAILPVGCTIEPQPVAPDTQLVEDHSIGKHAV
jgi:hypothetical protein